MIRGTYSVQLVCDFHQLLVHLDPDFLTLKHKDTEREKADNRQIGSFTHSFPRRITSKFFSRAENSAESGALTAPVGWY